MHKKPKSRTNIVYLEILDPKINGLIWQITHIIGGKGLVPQITVRGPYKEIASKNFDKCKKIIQEKPLRIGDVGRFSNSKEEVVYLKVKNENLRKIWNKPDFPIRKNGFNPHISLYRGKDKEWADQFEDFLKKENIEFSCNNHKLNSRKIKERNLESQLPPIDTKFPKYEDFLVRLKKLVNDYWLKEKASLKA